MLLFITKIEMPLNFFWSYMAHHWSTNFYEQLPGQVSVFAKNRQYTRITGWQLGLEYAYNSLNLFINFTIPIHSVAVNSCITITRQLVKTACVGLICVNRRVPYHSNISLTWRFTFNYIQLDPTDHDYKYQLALTPNKQSKITRSSIFAGVRGLIFIYGQIWIRQIAG